MALCDRVLDSHPSVTRVRVEITEATWSRLDVGGRAQGQAFMAGSPEQKTATVTSNGQQVAVVSGVDRLSLMRTTGFAPEAAGRADDGRADGLQRLLVGALSARWTYTSAAVMFKPYRAGVRAAIIDTFAGHGNMSVQHTLYAIAEVVLGSYQEIAEITLGLHERPYRPADLFSAGLENPDALDDLFIALDEPLGIVEVRVERDVSGST